MAIRSVEHQVISLLIDTELQNLVSDEFNTKAEDKPDEDINILKNILNKNEKEESKLQVSALDKGLEVLP